MNRVFELEDFSKGDIVLTPSGRRAIVVKLLVGTSKRDLCDRIICKFEDGRTRDFVTLQPRQLRHAPPSYPVHRPIVAVPVQLQFEFA